MLANHTSIAHLFERMLKQFGRLFEKRAFLDNYKRQPVFADDLEEFESSRDVVRLLTDEYRAAETSDYVSWAAGTDDDVAAAAVEAEFDEPGRGRGGTVGGADSAADDRMFSGGGGRGGGGAAAAAAASAGAGAADHDTDDASFGIGAGADAGWGGDA